MTGLYRSQSCVRLEELTKKEVINTNYVTMAIPKARNVWEHFLSIKINFIYLLHEQLPN